MPTAVHSDASKPHRRSLVQRDSTMGYTSLSSGRWDLILTVNKAAHAIPSRIAFTAYPI